MVAVLLLPKRATGMASSVSPKRQGILEFQMVSSPSSLTAKRWMASSSLRVSSIESLTGVMNSSSASEKSVVIEGWVNAEPKASGWPVCASMPSWSALRLSFSIPRWICRRRCCRGAAAKNASLCSSDVAKMASSAELEKAAKCKSVLGCEQAL